MDVQQAVSLLPAGEKDFVHCEGGVGGLSPMLTPTVVPYPDRVTFDARFRRATMNHPGPLLPNLFRNQ